MEGSFFDTSAFIKYYYPESGSDLVEKEILKARQITISEILKVEVASALARKVRARELSDEQRGKIWTTLLVDIGSQDVWVMPINSEQITLSIEILRTYGEHYPLRSLDALQLSAAKISGAEIFICSDNKLGKVAKLLFPHSRVIK